MNYWKDAAAIGLVLLGVFGLYAIYEHQYPVPSVIAAAETSVQLTHEGKGFCSGTFIQDPKGTERKTVLTAKHCIEEVGQVITIPYMGTNYEFKVEYVSDLSDLAILQSDVVFASPIAKVATSTSFRQKGVAIGYPLGLSQTITEGYVGSIETQDFFSPVSKSTAFLRVALTIAPGSSGGGLYQVSGGEYKLMGVATGINAKYFFVTYWTPVEEIQDFLRGING